MTWIRQIKDDDRMRLRTTSIPSVPRLAKRLLKVNRPIEAQRAVGQDINPLRLEVRRGVHDADLARLHEVIRDQQVLLVGRDLEVVRSDDALVLVRVVETLDVVEVGDVEGGDVVAEREREVGPLAVVGDVRVDGEVVARLGTEVEEQLGDALLPV